MRLRALLHPLLTLCLLAGPTFSQADDAEPVFANTAQPGNMSVSGQSFGYVVDYTLEAASASRDYTIPTQNSCASTVPLVVTQGNSYVQQVQVSRASGTAFNQSVYLGSGYGSSYSFPVPLDVGANTIAVDVTAPPGYTMHYNLSIPRAAPTSNANLSGLSLSRGSLNEVFSASTTTYTAAVSESTVDIRATLEDCGSLTVNGQTAGSGSPVTVNLAMGSNLIPIVVTAQDGTPRTYQLTITRTASADPSLAGLTLSRGTLSPGFAPGTTQYTASVAYRDAPVVMTATANSPTATMTLAGSPLASGSPYSLPLAVGANLTTIHVAAEDGAHTRDYQLTITRAAPSSENHLANLSVSAGSLNPAFSRNVTSYTLDLPSSTRQINLTATVADALATLRINGQDATSGSPVSLPVAYGTHTVEVLVTADNGDPRSYQLTLTRPGSYTALTDLTPRDGTLSPAFAPAVTAYSLALPYIQTWWQFTPTLFDNTSSLRVQGTGLASGKAVEVPLGGGTTPVTIRVGGAGGAETTRVAVTRAAKVHSYPGTAPEFFTFGDQDQGHLVTLPASGDFNEDGIPDVVLLGEREATAYVLFGDGVITLGGSMGVVPTSYASLSNRGGARQLVVADVNGDGHLDILFGGYYDHGVVVLLGQGNGHFTLAPLAGQAGSIGGLAVADFNGDGKMDLAYSDNDGDSVAVALGNGDGSFQPSTTILSGIASVSTLQSGDFDGDGRADLWVQSLTKVVMLKGHGNGQFETAFRYPQGAWSLITATAVGDFNGDGRPDLVLEGAIDPGSGVTEPCLEVLFVRADGSLASGGCHSVSGSGARRLIAADFNGDGDPDVAMITTVGGLQFLSGRGDGSFSEARTLAQSSLALAATALDINSDGKTDLVRTSMESNSDPSPMMSVLMNRSSDLGDITSNAGWFNTPFQTGQNEYLLTLPYHVTSATLTPWPTFGTGTLSINGNPVSPGQTATISNLLFGDQQSVGFAGSARNGSTLGYLVRVVRDSPDITGIRLSQGSLAPDFNRDIKAYTTGAVPWAVTHLGVSVTLKSGSRATLTVGGQTAVSGTPVDLPLAVGSNTLPVVLSYPDGSQNTYTLVVQRVANSNARLSALALSADAGASGTPSLSPGFSPDTLSYDVVVPGHPATLNITPTLADSSARVQINGQSLVSGASLRVALSTSRQTANIVVTAQDGSQQTYVLNLPAVTPSSFQGTTATGSGSAQATVTGGGDSCGFARAGFITAPGNLPAGVSFPHGLFDFALANCQAGARVTLTLTLPGTDQAYSGYWKYGPSPDNQSPHWYVYPASQTGNQITLTLTDGALGDDDLTANGTIVDAGGPGFAPGGAINEVPSLQEGARLLLALLLMGLGISRLGRRPESASHP